LVDGGADLHPLGRLGVWERLLAMAQERGVQLGMTFLDGTNIRAHQKAAGAAQKGATELDVLRVRHLADLVVAPVSFADISPRDRAFSPMEPRPA
jgi:hypothetical protein